MPFDLMLLAPAQDRIRGELGVIVGHDHLWLAAALDEGRQFAGNSFARDRGVRDSRQAFPRHVVDNVEDTEAATAGELVVHEVERSTGVRLGLDKDGRPGSYCLAAASTFAHG